MGLKFLFYIAFIFLGYRRFAISRERKYLIFSLLGLLDLLTNLLDQFVFTSNLELLLVNNLITLGLFFMFFYQIKNVKIPERIIFVVYVTIVFYAASIIFMDCPKAADHLYSDYGYLNTIEFSNFSIISAVICLALCTKVIVGIIKSESSQFNIIFITFGIIFYYIGDLFSFGLGTHFLNDYNAHFEFLKTLLPMRLFTTKCFILMGLIWKN